MHHNHIDRYAQGDTLAHRLDARAKLLGLVAYLAVLISFDRYAVLVLAPMAAGPLATLWFGHIPLRFALRRVLVLSPFILTLALMSPLYDRAPQLIVFAGWRWSIAAGWLTAADVSLKFALGVLAVTAVMTTTPFSSLLEAMRRLRAPRLLVAQLGLLYRYVFLLVDQAMRLRRARDFRGAGRASARARLAAVGGIIGALFVRSLDRSERVLLAMAVRGYRGEPRGLNRLRVGRPDVAMTALLAAYLLFCRWVYPSVV